MSFASIFPSTRKKYGSVFREQKLGDQLSDDVVEGRRLLEEAYREAFVVQCTVNEDYTFSNNIADNEVEEGIDVTDHIRPMPEVVTLTMKQSDTPISFTDLLQGAAVGVGAALGRGVVGGYGTFIGGVAAGGAYGKLLNGNSLRERGLAKTCYDQFKSLAQRGAILTIQTGLDLFTDMAISRLNFIRTSNTGKAIDFTVELRKIRIVSSEKFDLPQIPETRVSDSAKPTANTGRNAPKEVPESESALYKLGRRASQIGL